ncbi:MAG: RDD family protein [Phycisphaerae bacterium]|nr:RDD family protein [Phycisphaerae bacterium]
MSAKPDAVYYASEDYAHPARRLGAWISDLAILLVILSGIGIAVQAVYVPWEVFRQRRTPEVRRQVQRYMKPIEGRLSLGVLAAAVLYHVALRRLRGGTLGYRLMRIRLVDKTGEPPAWRVLVRRFLVAVPVTLPLGASYLRCRKDPKRQAVHDQWSGTWLVRKKARPAGPAITAYQTKLLGTYLLTYIDVEPYVPVDPPASEAEPTANPIGASTPTA